MDFRTQLAVSLVRWTLEVLQNVSWGGWLSAIVIFRLWRRTRYLKEALRRANASHLKELNEIQRRLLETFATAPPPSLRDLANDTGNDWRLR